LSGQFERAVRRQVEADARRQIEMRFKGNGFTTAEPEYQEIILGRKWICVQAEKTFWIKVDNDKRWSKFETIAACVPTRVEFQMRRP